MRRCLPGCHGVTLEVVRLRSILKKLKLKKAGTLSIEKTMGESDGSTAGSLALLAKDFDSRRASGKLNTEPKEVELPHFAKKSAAAPDSAHKPRVGKQTILKPELPEHTRRKTLKRLLGKPAKP